jgi:hypothetical protein
MSSPPPAEPASGFLQGLPKSSIFCWQGVLQLAQMKINSISPVRTVPVEDNPPQQEPFVAVLLYFQEILKKACANTNDTEESLFQSSITPDTLHFGVFTYELNRLTQEELFRMVKERRTEILQQKEHWRSSVDSISQGNLVPISSGSSGAYFLVDDEGIFRYVVKPVDEDIYCLNNRKEFGSPFNDADHRARDGIPIYRSAQTDALCSEIATLADIEGATPKAVMGIVKNDTFYDIAQWLDGEEKAKFIAETGAPDPEKLASIQEYIPNAQDLFELLHTLYKEGLSDEEITSCIDQKDFEEACLFLWLTYDNDGHAGNFLTFVKRIDEKGKKIYGIKKIDNSFSFPEENSHYVNTLAWVPNATFPLSADLKQKIAHLPVDEILIRMDKYEMTTCKRAFIERIAIVKELAQREGITLGEIDLRLTILSHKGGKEIALSTLTTQEILDLLRGENSEATSTTRGTHEAA